MGGSEGRGSMSSDVSEGHVVAHIQGSHQDPSQAPSMDRGQSQRQRQSKRSLKKPDDGLPVQPRPMRVTSLQLEAEKLSVEGSGIERSLVSAESVLMKVSSICICVYLMTLCVTCTRVYLMTPLTAGCLFCTNAYRIAGKFGKGFNLVIWRIEKIAK